jgi:DNA polymerase III epsilon subunit-like protein
LDLVNVAADAEVFISVDVETAGPIPGDYSLLAIGACLVADPTETFYVELQPISTRAVPEALQVSGFSLEALTATARPPDQAMDSMAVWVESFANEGSPVFVGFNASFDWSFVNWYFQHFSRENPFGIAALDIKSYFMGLEGTTWSNTRSSRLPTRYRNAESQTHTHNALDDAVEQAAMFSKMLEAARR